LTDIISYALYLKLVNPPFVFNVQIPSRSDQILNSYIYTEAFMFVYSSDIVINIYIGKHNYAAIAKVVNEFFKNIEPLGKIINMFKNATPSEYLMTALRVLSDMLNECDNEHNSSYVVKVHKSNKFEPCINISSISHKFPSEQTDRVYFLLKKILSMCGIRNVFYNKPQKLENAIHLVPSKFLCHCGRAFYQSEKTLVCLCQKQLNGKCASIQKPVNLLKCLDGPYCKYFDITFTFFIKK